MDILALDLGKYNTVFCDYNSVNGEHEFGKIKTTPEAVHDLIVATNPRKIVLEVCNIAGWIVDIARALDKETETANTTHDAWRWKNVKRKNDRDDALKLAKLSAMEQIPKVHIPLKCIREQRAFIKYRQRLIKHRTSIKNAIRAIFLREGITSIPRGTELWSKEGLRWLDTQAMPLKDIADIEQLWCGQLHVELQMFVAINNSIKQVEAKLDELAASNKGVRRLQTIPGVGPRLAETVVAVLDDPHRFQNSKQVGNYVGLTPRQYQSGQMEHQGRISGQGNKLLRNLLIEVCWVSLRYNPWARETYQRLLRGSPSRKKIAITALARKLVVRCWVMLRDEQDWKGDLHKKVA